MGSQDENSYPHRNTGDQTMSTHVNFGWMYGQVTGGCWFLCPSSVRWKKLGMKWELRMKTVKKRRGPNYSTHLNLILRGISPPVLDLPYYLLPWSWLVLKILRHIHTCQIKILQIFCIDTQFHEMVPNSAHFIHKHLNWGWKQGSEDQTRAQRQRVLTSL
jgi:hypothetical protein